MIGQSADNGPDESDSTTQSPNENSPPSPDDPAWLLLPFVPSKGSNVKRDTQHIPESQQSG